MWRCAGRPARAGSRRCRRAACSPATCWSAPPSSGGAAMALTDFRIHADGFSRMLVLDRSTTPRQAGRIGAAAAGNRHLPDAGAAGLSGGAQPGPLPGRQRARTGRHRRRSGGGGRAGRAGAARPADPAGRRDRKPRSPTTCTGSAPPRPITNWCAGASPSCASCASRGCRPSRSSPSAGWRRPWPPARRRRAPGIAVAARRPCHPAAGDTGGRDAGAAEPGGAGIDEPAGEDPAPPADHRRGPVGGGADLLRGGAGRRRGRGRRSWPDCRSIRSWRWA